MKLNFGHGIIALLLMFMAGMSYLVYRCTQQPIGLVNPEYYVQELKYSDQMDKVRNAKALNDAVEISYSELDGSVFVKYPFLERFPEIKGEVLFFKPDNDEFDFRLPVQMDTNHVQQINALKLAHGAWRVKINWEAKGISYYSEEKIFID